MEKSFLAEQPDGEAKVWHEFLDFLAQDEGTGAVVWTWTTFENDFAKKLWDRHGSNEQGYRVLTEGLQDQCAFVENHFAFPTDSYSIKKVAPIFGFLWQADDAGGLNSESWYGDWLQSGDEEIQKLAEKLGLSVSEYLLQLHRHALPRLTDSK